MLTEHMKHIRKYVVSNVLNISTILVSLQIITYGAIMHYNTKTEYKMFLVQIYTASLYGQWGRGGGLQFLVFPYYRSMREKAAMVSWQKHFLCPNCYMATLDLQHLFFFLSLLSCWHGWSISFHLPLPSTYPYQHIQFLSHLWCHHWKAWHLQMCLAGVWDEANNQDSEQS